MIQTKVNTHLQKFKPWLSSLILLPIMIWLLDNNGDFIPLIDHFTLLIHEGGHGIFRIFGIFIYTLGGTLAQILIGLLFIYYFYLTFNNPFPTKNLNTN